VVVNLVCYLGQFSEDGCTHSRPLDLKTARDFICLEEVVFHSEAGFQRDMINHGEAIVFNVGGGSSISGGGRDVSFESVIVGYCSYDFKKSLIIVEF